MLQGELQESCLYIFALNHDVGLTEIWHGWEIKSFKDFQLLRHC